MSTRIETNIETTFIHANNITSQRTPAVGTIVLSVLNEDQIGPDYALCDGRSCVGSKYSQITQLTAVPDMRNRFIRGTTISSEVGTIRGSTTSVSGLSLTLSGAGAHTHTGTTIQAGAHAHSLL
jgi:hypothetical protein